MTKMPPNWMDKKFFMNVLKYHEKPDELHVIDFTVTSGSIEKQNFASDMYKAKIEYKTNENSQTKFISVIIKALPDDELRLEMSFTCPLFETELNIYGKALGKIESLLEKAAISTELFPRLIYESEEPTVIVLEDVSVDGFTAINYPENYEVSKLIFKRLAQFHAASYYLIENGEDFSEFNFSVYHMPDFIQDGFFRQNLKIFREVMEKVWCNDKRYLDRVDDVINKFQERGQKIYSPNLYGGYNVLAHGDLNLKNMLFKKENGTVSDVQFIDFQVSILGSPAIDLIYAIYSSMSPSNRKKHKDDIILYYYENFTDTLKLLEFNKCIPSLNDLHTELVKNGSLAAQLSICYMPYLFYEWKLIKTDSCPDNTIEFKRELYESEVFQQFAKEEFTEFFYKGFI